MNFKIILPPIIVLIVCGVASAQIWEWNARVQFNVDDDYTTVDGTGYVNATATLEGNVIVVDGRFVKISGKLPEFANFADVIATDGMERALEKRTTSAGSFTITQIDKETWTFHGVVSDPVLPINNGHFEVALFSIYNGKPYYFFLNTDSPIDGHYLPSSGYGEDSIISAFYYNKAVQLYNMGDCINASINTETALELYSKEDNQQGISKTMELISRINDCLEVRGDEYYERAINYYVSASNVIASGDCKTGLMRLNGSKIYLKKANDSYLHINPLDPRKIERCNNLSIEIYKLIKACRLIDANKFYINAENLYNTSDPDNLKKAKNLIGEALEIYKEYDDINGIDKSLILLKKINEKIYAGEETTIIHSVSTITTVSIPTKKLTTLSTSISSITQSESGGIDLGIFVIIIIGIMILLIIAYLLHRRFH